MLLNRKNIQILLTTSLVFLFSISQVGYSFHQLDHLEDVVCSTKDTHYHKDHDDFCKDLSISSLATLKDKPQLSYFNSSIVILPYCPTNYLFKVHVNVHSRAPPSLD